MKPAPFVYHAPSSVDEALGLLEDLREDDAKVLAGGQSLMPLLNMRLARPAHLVDINGLNDLNFMRGTDGGGLAVGALTRHRSLERSPNVARLIPLLVEAIPFVGDRQVRFRGTIGGSLAHADPVAELPTVALALDAELVIGGPSGHHTVPASDFFLDFLTTALEPPDLLLEVRFPPPERSAGYAFLELARQLGAYAIVSAAAMIALEDGRISSARLCLGGVGPTPIRVRRAEALLVGQQPGPEAFSAAARLAAEQTDPGADVHASAAYRRDMAEVYARRALELAASRAATNHDSRGSA